MKNFKVTVNGTTYDVAVEEMAEGNAAVHPMPAPVQAAKPVQSAPKPAAPAKPAVSSSAFKLTAPMPGTIADIKVRVGDTVTKDQCGIILEAMKMENEIFIPVAGKVTSILIEKGTAVKTGDILLTVE